MNSNYYSSNTPSFPMRFLAYYFTFSTINLFDIAPFT